MLAVTAKPQLLCRMKLTWRRTWSRKSASLNFGDHATEKIHGEIASANLLLLRLKVSQPPAVLTIRLIIQVALFLSADTVYLFLHTSLLKSLAQRRHGHTSNHPSSLLFIHLKPKMSDQFKELLDIPRDFLHDGTQFMNRSVIPRLCRLFSSTVLTSPADVQNVSYANPIMERYESNFR